MPSLSEQVIGWTFVAVSFAVGVLMVWAVFSQDRHE